jgi:Domain of unknown function (DUF4440)
MKLKLFICMFNLVLTSFSYAQQPPTETIKSDTIHTKKEQEIINLSKSKWQWMADKNMDQLDKLFDEKSMFIHMGGTWGKATELKTIKEGGIWYKKATIHAVTVNTFGNTAILLNDIDLVAVVGDKEVNNPFMVTEVYTKSKGKWKLASLTFSLLRRPFKS